MSSGGLGEAEQQRTRISKEKHSFCCRWSFNPRPLQYLKELCHEMNNFLKAYYDNYVLSVYVLIAFTMFCFLMKTSNSKFKLSPLKLHTNFENPSSNPFQKP